jgi:tetratricopeptide (TPR) repeat protein
MTDPAAPLTPTSPAPPDWTAFARAGEWRRALAAARVTGAAELAELLEGVLGVQEGVRARRFGQARRALAGLREGLADAGARGLGGEAAVIASLVNPDALNAALTALEGQGKGRDGETEPDALRERLAPALAQPLTRAEALNALGVLHALREEPDAARALLEEARAADPGHYRALTNLGNLDLEANDPAGAEARYREALRLQPDHDGAHHNLGVALRRQGKLHEAVGSIRRAQRLNVRRSQADTRDELREQFRAGTNSRTLRWVLLALAAGLVLYLLLRGAGG